MQSKYSYKKVILLHNLVKQQLKRMQSSRNQRYKGSHSFYFLSLSSVSPFIHPSVHPSIHLSIHASISICIYVFGSMYLHLCISVFESICICIYMYSLCIYINVFVTNLFVSRGIQGINITSLPKPSQRLGPKQ